MSVQKKVNAKIRPETISVNVTVVIPLFREVKVQNRSKTSRKKTKFTYKYFFRFLNFRSNQRECEDVNECDTFGTCGDFAICENLEGSHICKCLSGFEPDDGVRCKGLI